MSSPAYTDKAFLSDVYRTEPFKHRTGKYKGKIKAERYRATAPDENGKVVLQRIQDGNYCVGSQAWLDTLTKE